MYRVELKGNCKVAYSMLSAMVPNVPCGVESSYKCTLFVFNPLFLMYRVELKAYYLYRFYTVKVMFLMYRVELKDCKFADFKARTGLFLMYRVELKVLCYNKE